MTRTILFDMGGTLDGDGLHWLERFLLLYRDHGSMATIGRASAVADLGRLHFSGFIGWMMWLFIHLLYIVQYQSRLLVFIQWGWNYVTRNRAARLITGQHILPMVTEKETETA